MNSLLAAPAARTWRSVGPALLLCIALLLLFRETVADMVSIWIRSDTFNHAFLVPPIAAWLAWRRRAELAVQPHQPVAWVLLPLTLACLLWLLGHLGSVAPASQLALVTLLLLTVPALYGWSVTRILLFPLLFLYFAVPIGEFVVPQLQEWTADVTVMALRISGIPVYREGNQFIIPSGSWSVVEACSGIRYLMACFVVGTLFAYLNYRSTRRRLAFLLVLLAFPVMANWIRAYTIVMIGHLTGSPMILGVSHMTYGWVLFGALIVLLFLVAARWAEQEVPAMLPKPVGAAQAVPGAGLWWIVCAILALSAGTQALAWRLDHGSPLTSPNVQLSQGAGGWRVDSSVTALPWTPGFVNPSDEAFKGYEKADRRVAVWIGYYRSEQESRKLVSSVNGVVASDDVSWRQQKTHKRPATTQLPAFQTSTVSRGSFLGFAEAERMQVWQAYWVNGRWTHSDAETKLWQVWDRLLARGDEGAVVVLVSSQADDSDSVLSDFANANLPAINAALAAVRDSR